MANDDYHSEDPALDPAAGPIWALGLMSGTSMDGIDAALIRTDGITVAEIGPAIAHGYDDDTGAALRAAIAGVGAGAGNEDAISELERALTDAHGEAVAALLARWRGTKSGAASMPAVIGFHGHTLWHRPELGQTRQIGNGARLARQTGIQVVNDFRGADMAAGGQGAPFASLYHAARLRGAGVDFPVAVLNLGGVANVTWVHHSGTGAGNGAGEDSGAGDRARETGTGDKTGLLAFDTGPASAMIDDWVRQNTGKPFDEGGALAASGGVDEVVLKTMLADPYFEAPPPKSLDRLDFDRAARELQRAGLSAADGAATLTAFTARTVARAAQFLPEPAKAWYATGGGRHNVTLMAEISEALGGAALGAGIRPVEDLGWNGDMLEAEAFAYLAVRSLKGLALSLPATTGVAKPTTGGRLHRP